MDVRYTNGDGRQYISWAEQEKIDKQLGLITPMEDIEPADSHPPEQGYVSMEGSNESTSYTMQVCPQGEYGNTGSTDMGYQQPGLQAQVSQAPQVNGYMPQAQYTPQPSQLQPQPYYQVSTFPVPLSQGFIEQQLQKRIDREEADAAECLRQQNKRMERVLLDQAYTDTESKYGKTWTQGRSGFPQELMDATVKAAHLFQPEPPMNTKPFYLLDMDDKGFLRIEEDIFTSDTKLIDALQKQHIDITPRGTIRKAASLLRKEINRKLEQHVLLFYGGWRQYDEKNSSYRVFEGGRPAGKIGSP